MNQQDLTVRGFQFAAVKSGIRGKDRLDLGLIYCSKQAEAAAVFTTNQVKAAPVLLGLERIAAGQARAVMINAGIANACTGALGLSNARASAAMVARELAVPEALVYVASTGVIGAQLEMNCFAHVTELVAGLGPEKIMEVARAMMTTDTVPKVASRQLVIDGVPVKLVGIAKGAGMIMPNMATMLSFVMTDARVSSHLLAQLLRASVEQSFNRITIDGDTSTNDTVMLLASGEAGHRRLERVEDEAAAELQKALDDLTRDLALQIVVDGEGATKLVTIAIKGARSAQEAEAAARTIANSPLVKTAFFGQDANWGRIIAALGRSGAQFDQGKVAISFDEAAIVANGLWLGSAAEKEASAVLQKKSFLVTVDLQAGSASCQIHTCDLSLDYVKINADYRS